MNTCPYCQQEMPWPRPDADVRRIVALVADDFTVDEHAIMGRDRTRPVAEARAVAMYLARELTDHSYPALGRAFGRDHSTIQYAHREVAAKNRTDRVLRECLRLLADEFAARRARQNHAAGVS